MGRRGLHKPNSTSPSAPPKYLSWSASTPPPQHLFVWLGEVVDPNIHGPLPTPEEVASINAMVDSVVGPPSETEVPWNNIQEFKKAQETKREVAAHFYDRDWYRRRWVIQEVMNSSGADFLVGPYAMSLEEFTSISGSITVPMILRRFKRGSDWYAQYEENDLLANLIEFDLAECSDPRDRIYALLGVSSDGGEFKVDYTLSAKALYLQVATYYIEHGRAATILLRGTCKDAETAKLLPSWCPDFGAGYYKSHEQWKATSWEHETENVWGGANLKNNIQLSGRVLVAETWILGPCNRNHEPTDASCPVCASAAHHHAFPL